MDNNLLRQPRTWVEVFALLNLGGLAPDILLAHSTNAFHSRAEFIPLVFSVAAPLVLLPALWALAKGNRPLWSTLGNCIGWASVGIGIVGLVMHLKSQFFEQWTLASLVYAAPFAAPLAYTGIGLLLLLNRSVKADSRESAEWVLFLALGGFIGNFIFSVTDHAQNGFFRSEEWVPVIASGLAVGFLATPLLTRVGQGFFKLCLGLLALEVLIGVSGLALHLQADWKATGKDLFEKIVHGAPVFAPALFCDLAVLAAIGLWQLGFKPPADERTARIRNRMSAEANMERV